MMASVGATSAVERRISCTAGIDEPVVEDLHRNYDLTLSLPGYTGATWIIEGERDGMGTATIEEITRQLPQAVFLPLANVGHFPWHEDPVLFDGRIAEALA